MLHIDGDLIAYRIACAVGDDADPGVIGYTLNSFIAKEILIHFEELTPYHVYLSGDTNFRDDVATTVPYKGNRWTPERRQEAFEAGLWHEWLEATEHIAPKTRPAHLALARQHLIDVWGATVTEGIEADDAIATAATIEAEKFSYDQNIIASENVKFLPTIVSLDKDFDQLSVARFNFVNKKTTHYSPMYALKNLYKQCLTGDATDNIIGVEGMGPVGAAELIDGCTKELDMILICSDQLGYERFLENMYLVYLRRSEGESWTDAADDSLLNDAYYLDGGRD